MISPYLTKIAGAFVIVLILGSGLGCRPGSQNSQPPAQETASPRTRPVTDTSDWKPVDQAMGRVGTAQPGGVHKYSMPRTDLRVTVGSVTIKPSLALGSWLAFKRLGAEAVAMGDLVLTESEIAPVMAKLQELGIEQSALHNHLLHESPSVMYMHIQAHGDPIKIAEAVRQALSLTKTPAEQPRESKASASLGIDTTALRRALGRGGKVSSGVYQVNVPRTEAIREDGTEVPPSMGVATAINFQPTSGGKAVATGDFVMIASEVNPVLQALSSSGIQVTALHNHMLGEEPRLFFAHFWGNNDAEKLARALRTALDKTNVKRDTP